MSLTTEELSLLRNEAEDWRPDLCDIYRTTLTNDPYGGHGTSAESQVATGVSCTVETGAGHEQTIQLLGFERPSTLFLIFLPADQDIRVGDHIIVTTKGNQHMEVSAVMAPETHEIERMVVATSLAEHHS